MTFRAKPVAKRPQKHSWESRDRRSFYLNLGFGLVVVAAVAILLIAVAVTYYNDNLRAVGSVDGEAITIADWRQRGEIENWRLTEAQNRIRTQTVAGRLTEAQAQLQTQLIQQQLQGLEAAALEHLIDNRIQADLANEAGITVTDADVDAQLVEEATTPEARHAWVIEVEPEVDPGAAEPTAEQVAAAKAKADKALADITSGTSWDDIAKTVSTDASTAPQAGDLGWVQVDDRQLDEAFMTAINAAAVDTPTAVIEGEDGIFRIGRVTEIAGESVDDAYQDKIVNDGIDLAAYRQVVRGDVIRQRLEDQVVADATKPGPQRDTAEIYLSQSTTDLPAEAVKVRHILFSPKDDPVAAQSGDIPEDDPSWGQAELDAEGAVVRLKQDPSQFDALAREISDEDAALGPDGTGGLLSAYVAPDGTYVEEFETAILEAKAKDGDIIGPFRSPFGYHVVQVVHHRPTMDDLVARLERGEDFAELARTFSEGAEAADGGALGWVAKSQLDERLIAGIFGAPVPGLSDVITIADDGQYLYHVAAEEERTPEGRQLEAITSRAFSDWYALKKASVEITRDEEISATAG